MRFCVYGAGTIGGHLAARLASVGHDVSVVWRGANPGAIRARAIALQHGERTVSGARARERLAARKGLYS